MGGGRAGGRGRVCRAALALLALAVASCARDRPRVLVLGFDGLDPDAIELLAGEGKLPNFSRLRREGAYGRLLSSSPMLSPILWTTIATGRTADAHGIGHFVALDPATGASLPVTSDLRQVRALWNILAESDRSTVVVGWWATWPPEPIRGAVVSDHLMYHFLFGDGLGSGDPTVKTYPPELERRLAPLIRRPAAIGRAELAPFADIADAELAPVLDLRDELSHLRWLVASAETYRAIGLELWRSERPDLGMVYFESTDSIAHLFGHLFRAQGLAGELARQQRRYGHAVEAMYARADAILGDYLAAADRNTTLVVLSDHGFELGALPDDPSRLRDMRRVSERFHRLEGVLYLYGNRVRAGARIDRPTHLDIAPTVLALEGLPASREMSGRLLGEALVGVVERPRIRTYERKPRKLAASGGRDARADRELFDHLRSLGYLGDGGTRTGEGAQSSPQAERNLAAIAFQEKDYTEAERRYRALLVAEAESPGLHASLAGVLGAQGRYEEARAELDRALELEPVNPEGHHNLGVLLERLGRRPEAVEQYRTALRYRADFEPSRLALRRLTGSADVRAPTSDAERRAATLCQQAADLARHGDFATALTRLDEAQRAAPKFVLVYQYEANVAYLAGDRPRAIAALEHALALEPDNALFRHNLEELKHGPG